jgi:DNA repair exonuclease SbcCD ATPase subunit
MPSTLSPNPTVSSSVSLGAIEPRRGYLERAFLDQHNVIALLGAVAFSLAFASPWPLTLAAVTELFWLALGPRLPAFRARLDRREVEERREREQALLASRPVFRDSAFAARFAALSQGAEQVRDLCARYSPSAEVMAGVEHALERLRSTFVAFAEAQHVLALELQQASAARWPDELSALKHRLSRERDLEQRMALRNSIVATEKALAQREALISRLQALGEKIDILQQSPSALMALRPDSRGAGHLLHELNARLNEVGPAPSIGP